MHGKFVGAIDLLELLISMNGAMRAEITKGYGLENLDSNSENFLHEMNPL